MVLRFFFVLSISPLCIAAWVTFDGVGSNRACFVLHTRFFGMLHVYLSRLSSNSLSFFNSHPTNRVSFSRLKSFRSSPISFRAPARASMWSFTGVRLSISFPILPLCVSILMRRWPVSRVGGGIRSCALPKERNRSYLLPQDHGALAQLRR